MLSYNYRDKKVTKVTCPCMEVTNMMTSSSPQLANSPHYIVGIVKAIVTLLINKYVPKNLLCSVEKERVIKRATFLAAEDLKAFAKKDPAAKNSELYVLNSYLCFWAILAYRVAHELYCLECLETNFEKSFRLQIIARKISEDAKVKTGIEIHPEACIGRRFIIDHGWGTVIGQTTTIGDDCYILQGVILGAKGIANNQQEKRHPTLGNRVELGSFVKIFGAVTVGDDVKVSPHCRITTDIPSNIRVVMVSEYKIIKNSHN